jgi:hypothetical protein
MSNVKAEQVIALSGTSWLQQGLKIPEACSGESTRRLPRELVLYKPVDFSSLSDKFFL